MAGWSYRYFRELKDAVAFLNGIIPVPVNLAGGLDLDGKTLIIDKNGGGNRTVTFTAKGSLWSAEEIVTAITGTHADLADAVTLFSNVGSFHHGRGQIYLRIGNGSGDTFTIRGNGTANPVFGLPSPATPANDTVGVPLANTEAEILRNVDVPNPWAVVIYK